MIQASKFCVQSDFQVRKLYLYLVVILVLSNSVSVIQKMQFFSKNFLDDSEYSWENISDFDSVLGKSFASTGGQETAQEFIDSLSLQSGDYVLDFGSGIGESACYMAEKYNVQVLGVDLHSNMILKARRYLKESKNEFVRENVQSLN